MHSVDELRRQRLQESTKPFRSRGSSLKRCDKCQLGLNHCICNRLIKSQCQCDLALIMHRNELLKPSNSGRLIADTLPDNTHAFIWSRTEPSQELLSLLKDNERQCLLVFPPRDGDGRTQYTSEDITTKKAANWNEKKLTLILLDGTWKQARKIYALSTWLKDIPCLTLCDKDIARCANQYGLRQAHTEGLSSTCEAAAIALHSINERIASADLLKNFHTFNTAYMACRANLQPNNTK